MKLSVVLLLASFVLLATSKPARKGGAGEDHSPIPLHLRELYNKLEEGSARLVSGANTVHSLQSIAPTAPQCGIFNFSLSEIDAHHEQIKKVELNLYLVRREANASPLFVTVRSGNKASHIKVQEVRARQKSGWIVFNVRHEIVSLIKSDEKQAVFKVYVYQSMADSGNNEGHLDCELSPLTFVNSLADEDQAPYLTVQSHDSRLDKINYKTMRESQASSRMKRRGIPFPTRSTMSPVTSTDSPTDVSTDSPTVNPTGLPSSSVCGVNELIISTQFDSFYRIIVPRELNIGVCGGQCRNLQALNNYFALLEYTIRTNPEDDLKFKQVCVPTEFSPISAIVARPDDDQALSLLVFNDVRVRRCSCLGVVDLD